MNILVFSWRDPKHPLAGGAEQVMHEHMKGWIEAGYQVTLFSSRFKNSSSDEILDGVKIIRKGNQYHLGVQLAGCIHYMKNATKYDFVVDQFHGMPFFTPIYCGKPKLAVIQETTREVWFLNHFPKPINWVYGVIGFLLEPFVFLFYRNTTFMIGSMSAKEDLIKMGILEKNITVIPHGVIIKKPKSTLKKSKPRVVAFLGVLSKDKGIEDAIYCFSKLITRDLRFWVIGRAENPKYAVYLKLMCKRLGIDKKVNFWGFVSQEKKFELLSKAQVLINPSVKEGWGLVNIEANAVGTPVVAYKSFGLIDSVCDGLSGIFSKEKTPQSLAQTVDSLLTDNRYLAKISNTAISWSKKFSWERSKKESLELINSLT